MIMPLLEQMEMDPVLLDHMAFRNTFLAWLSRQNNVTLLTLGPEETSSYIAADYLTSYVKQHGLAQPIAIKTFEHFSTVYEQFKNGCGELIIVPNAYEHITKMYWDEELEIVFSYYYPTPLYGLAAKNEQYRSKERITIACCPAVFSLIDKLGSHLIIDKHWELRTVASTTMAAEAVHEGLADIAVTNQTSLDKYNLHFIAEGFGVNMLWTVFKRRKD